ncbi:bifunctional 23S rRNA (guanine(2069)-N(7))-methyltransferase RlmK/23S rRNA (guanine(2445)-N(2))-methyltransferase RlmL [Thiomicrorhabdus sp. zzn3]|uniref:bifunctional 23S rRNA (guanine(2069)-N(7))-methyltransferase RlmK/23S rRNA (guanine(2445)-N(2))-methyltransferase RlmL n=1 Tax=Thiomicrorhabdus sp. zzn3 TaxID=3039775 RepID=UPI002436D314|nr:bifunctional 23S rRNA (guanine(2069)-N(7))-methyltransferase RlmK/23S rRNA (guanine(2445)-N(2))-methyltransferase RlmL [Thiomicrorhabdus sp. zzn3]MDG6779074.1 bifunctional 23S rRNA (guanine(2069)-N(7))-methyltransferase RlmK/23S rRNA (guanine(2445)-N(2))-methyltransferase RlmL [Thiomicrorhabdus sp. zzn3]
MLKCFATAPGGLSELLREELMSFGAQSVKAQPRGVSFEGSLEVAYRACLWSRLANRIYVTVLETKLDNQEALTPTIARVDWKRHMDADGSFAVSFSGKGLGIEHSHYGALKIKDGIVDYFRETFQQRPQVDTFDPDLRVHGHINRNQLTLSIDLTGHSLHQRGYREGQQVKAPLKENVAAALLMRAGWPEIAKQGGTLYDPMCGSGTFMVEAAMMASDLAPGLDKANQMAFLTWKQHDEVLWQRLLDEAEQREAEGLRNLPEIYGSDASHKSLDIAYEAIANAGYDDAIEIKQMTVEQGRRWGDWKPGLVISNPPYGERLGEVEEVKALYVELGNYLKNEFDGWQAAILTCNAELGMYLGLKAKRSHSFFNGALECKLLRFDIVKEFHRQPAIKGGLHLAQEIHNTMPELAESEGAQMFANRVRKNLKGLRKWAQKEEVFAYRVYDADMPEYALAIDFYQTLDDGNWLVVNEYAPPKSVDRQKARKRLYEAMAALPLVFHVPVEQIVFKVRERQKGASQYERLDESKQFFTIMENGVRLRVNFTDYLDTGLFLDHRDVRAYVAKQARGKRLVNLFCYTASATAQAAAQGARTSLSVDMSKTYLWWAKHNLMANRLDEDKHKLLQANVLEWLDTAAKSQKGQVDVVFLDPPSFSTSKRMEGTLDIQRDHVDLISKTLLLLKPGGELIFSNNLRKFKLDKTALEQAFPGIRITDITQKTMPKDFERNAKIHQAWSIIMP